MPDAPADSAPIRVLVVDDHPLMREGISYLLDAQGGAQVIAEASSGEEALVAFKTHAPDVTLVDLQMPGMNGFETIAALRAIDPDARVVVLTTYGGDGQATRALKSGACGYVLKTADGAEILAALRAAIKGRHYLSPQVANQLAAHAGHEPLTAREIEVLRCVIAGKSNLAIARQLCIAEETVKSRMKNILSKLHASDRTHAATIAIARGLIDGP